MPVRFLRRLKRRGDKIATDEREAVGPHQLLLRVRRALEAPQARRDDGQDAGG